MDINKVYKVRWSKTYYVSGELDVKAYTRKQAEEIVSKQIGDLTGSMQYDPNEDYIEVEE